MRPDWAEASRIAPSPLATGLIPGFWPSGNPEDESNALAHGWRFETVGRELAALFAVD